MSNDELRLWSLALSADAEALYYDVRRFNVSEWLFYVEWERDLSAAMQSGGEWEEL